MGQEEDDFNEDPDPADQDPDFDDGATATMECPYCGQAIVENAEFCHHCGKYISEEDSATKQPKWFLIGIVLCVLLVLAIVILGIGQMLF